MWQRFYQHWRERRFKQHQRGQAFIEYALLIALVGLAAMAILHVAGGAISNTFRDVVCNLGSGEDCACDVSEVITKGPNNVCIGGTFAFSTLTSCGDRTTLSLMVDGQEFGLSYDGSNDIFSTSVTDQTSLCNAIQSGGVDGYLISRHNDDETVNTFPVSLTGSTVGDDEDTGGDDGDDGSGDDDGTGGDNSGGGGGPEATEPPSAATCPNLVLTAMTELEQNCSGLGRNVACYGNHNVLAQFYSPVDENYFSVPADEADLFNVRDLATSALSLSADEWGIAVLNVQANLPNTLPGQNVVMLLVGDADVENDVGAGEGYEPADPLDALTQRGSSLRSAPTLNANVVGGVAPNTMLAVDGISPDGNWMRTWRNGVTGWIHREVVTVNGSINTLPTISASSYTPMQAFHLQTRIADEPDCADVPNVLLLQNPQNTIATLRVNDNTISIGSTIVMRTDAATGRLEVIVLEGAAHLNDVELPTCHRALVDGGRWTDMRVLTAAEQNEMQVLEGIPASMLHYPVSVCDTVGSPSVPAAGALWAGSATCSKVFELGGNGTTINGNVHSNGDIDSNNNGHSIYGDVTYVTTNGGSGYYEYPYPVGASGNTPQQVGIQSDPVNVTIARFAPGGDIAVAAGSDYHSTTGRIDITWLTSQGYYSGGVLQDGIYYTSFANNTAIDLNVSNLTGADGLPARVTFVAGNGGIQWGGSNTLLEPYVGPTGDVAQNIPGILMYAGANIGSPTCNNAAIHLNGGGSIGRGILYAPGGLIHLSSSGNSLNGSLVGNAIKFTGSSQFIGWDRSLFP